MLLTLNIYLQTAEKFVELVISMDMTIWAFILIFIICELSERLTTRFNEIHNEILQCDWYIFPHDVQRILPIIMSGTQNPFLFTGIGNIVYTRDAFKRVCNSFGIFNF